MGAAEDLVFLSSVIYIATVRAPVETAVLAVERFLRALDDTSTHK